MENYVAMSLETHLFFARIMREHALFLEAGFPCVERAWTDRADWFRQEFERLLADTVRISNRRVGACILNSQELTTEFTLPAEKRTERLSGIPIDSRITVWEQELAPGCEETCDREVTEDVHRINRRALQLLQGLIEFKEKLLEEVSRGKVFNANYPLLIQHILREAKLYCATVEELMDNRQPSYGKLKKTEEFWNRIMMEHALFIRGLLDPTEVKLIGTADEFAVTYEALLEKARQQDCRAMEGLTKKTLEETKKYSAFKAAGTEGILECKIASVILPLLADHVLREANHYIRLLETED